MYDVKISDYIAEYVNKAKNAQSEYEKMSSHDYDKACTIIAKTVYNNAEILAELAVKETHMGNMTDKVLKNKRKAELILNSLKGKKSKGIISKKSDSGIAIIAKPIGVIAALTPCTNPNVTPMCIAMFALKCGNSVIFEPHHRSIKSTFKTIDIINMALKTAGFPMNLIQMLNIHSMKSTTELMRQADMIVASVGDNMVKRAYSCGKPAIGVSRGNVQVIIDEKYNIGEAVKNIVTGRVFDNGIVCTSEQSVICDSKRFEDLVSEFIKSGAYIVRNDKELQVFNDIIFDDRKMNLQCTGQSAKKIASFAGIKLENEKMILICSQSTIGGDLFGREKMFPVLTAYRYDSFDDAIRIAKTNLELEGRGHTACIYSDDKDKIEYAASNLDACRIIINQGCEENAGGSYYNGLDPTNSFCCGSWGNSAISDNLTYSHFMNKCRIAYNMPDKHVPTEDELWTI